MNGKTNGQRIVNALQHINEDGINAIEKAYQELNMIKGLGASYISKILYFATRAKDVKKYAVIYDTRVAQALIQNYSSKAIYDIVSILPKSDFMSCRIYNDLIHKKASEYEVDPEQLEWYLFTRPNL